MDEVSGRTVKILMVVFALLAVPVGVYTYNQVLDETGVRARVECVPTEASIQCRIHRESGQQGSSVCFDIDMPCANGVHATVSDCGQLPSGIGGSTGRMISWERIRNAEACDEVVGFVITIGEIQ